MLGLLRLLTSDKDLQQLLSNPKVSRQQLQDLVVHVCGDGLSKLGRNLVKLLLQADRLQYAPYIKNQYEQMRAAAEGKMEVEVVTAYQLDRNSRTA